MRKKQTTPIFVISFNRKWQLERSLASYRQLGSIKIIIHDNGSDNPEVIKYLKELELSGTTVYKNTKITEKSGLNSINESIDKYFSHNEPTNYIVTDPDIELLPNSGKTISIYNYFLAEFPEIESVGPMLRIDDIPSSYLLYNHAVNRHIQQFWGQKPEIIYYKNEPLAYLKCPIDTSFSMHRAQRKFRRHSKGIRLYEKYSARHLDWYNENRLDNEHTNGPKNNISHWRNPTYHNKFENEPLEYDSYFDVVQSGRKMSVVRKKVRSNGNK
jgi:hypothetical protein